MRLSTVLSGLLVGTVLLFSACDLLVNPSPGEDSAYSVIYHGNGSGTGAPPTDSNRYSPGESVVVQGNSGNLSRQGYTFAGWNTSSSPTGTMYSPGQSFSMPARNVDLYGFWAQNFRAIHFNANGGSGTMIDQTVAEGVPTALSPVQFFRSGYLFSGWNTNSAAAWTEYADQAAVTVGNQGLTLYAIWTPSDNTVTFQANGGTGTMSAVSTTPGVWVQLPDSSLTRTGYTFSEWNTEPDGSGTSYSNLGFMLPGATSVILHAQWDPIQSFLYFDANEGDGSMAYLWGDYGTTVPLTPADYGRPGYVFTGWATYPDGNGDTYSDGANYTFGETNVTLYAQWQQNVHTITFLAPGASGTMTAVNVSFETHYTLPAVTFTKTGHSLAGWSEQPSDETPAYANQGSITMPDRPLILYAQWSPNVYSVTFHANGGTGSMEDQHFTYGTVRPLASNQFSNGVFLFSGWSDSSGGSAVWSDTEGYNTGASDRDLYAVWSNSVSIGWSSGPALTFNPSSATVTVGQTVTLEAVVAGAANWRWYVDNVRVPDQATGTYEFTPSTHGFHTVSVLVTANGMTLSGNIVVRVKQ